MSNVFQYAELSKTVNTHICTAPFFIILGGGPRVVVSTAAFHARVRGSVPGLGGLKGKKMFLPHPRVKVSIVGSLRDREVACSASDRQGPNFESCVWRTVSSQSSHHPQEVLLAQFSLYVHKGGLKPDSFHFSFLYHIFIETLQMPHLKINTELIVEHTQSHLVTITKHHSNPADRHSLECVVMLLGPAGGQEPTKFIAIMCVS